MRSNGSEDIVRSCGTGDRSLLPLRCVKYELMGLHEFIVESREPGSQHRLTRNTFDIWLRRPSVSEADVALKTRLQKTLGRRDLAVSVGIIPSSVLFVRYVRATITTR